MNRSERITTLLETEFQPSHLEVINESPLHHVGEAVETHFKIILVSAQFKSRTLIQRHRAVNALIKPEFDEGLHALTLHLFTPEEWDKKQNADLTSPACRGGFHAH